MAQVQVESMDLQTTPSRQHPDARNEQHSNEPIHGPPLGNGIWIVGNSLRFAELFAGFANFSQIGR